MNNSSVNSNLLITNNNQKTGKKLVRSSVISVQYSAKVQKLKNFKDKIFFYQNILCFNAYHEQIKMFHVKDAEFNASGRSGVYGGYQDWVDRPGRFRSLGDGQIDFRSIFSKLTQYGYDGWAVLEWECCIKDSEQGAAEGATFIKDHLITVTERAFDDFAGGKPDEKLNRRICGL